MGHGSEIATLKNSIPHYIPIFAIPNTEGCESGLIGTPGKCVYIKSVPGFPLRQHLIGLACQTAFWQAGNPSNKDS